jgi:hypothetical protein
VNLVRTIALAVIAVILCFDIGVRHLWPWVSLSLHEQEYYEAALACISARSSMDSALEAPGSITPTTKQRLVQAAEVELYSCHDLETIGSVLLADGVDPQKLKLTWLEALDASQVPLRYVVEPYIGKVRL